MDSNIRIMSAAVARLSPSIHFDLQILKRVYKSIGIFNESKEFLSESVSKHILIDGRFHILLFFLGQIFWITTLAITTLISEILILLNYYDLVVAYAFTLPLYK